MKPIQRIVLVAFALSPLVAMAQPTGLTRQQVYEDLVRSEQNGYTPGINDQRYPGTFLDVREGIYTGASVYSARPANTWSGATPETN